MSSLPSIMVMHAEAPPNPSEPSGAVSGSIARTPAKRQANWLSVLLPALIREPRLVSAPLGPPLHTQSGRPTMTIRFSDEPPAPSLALTGFQSPLRHRHAARESG